MGLTEDVGRGPVALDTSALIYLIEDHARFAPLLAPLIEKAEAGDLALVTSAITLLEVLVLPYRAGDLALASRYEALLTRSRELEMVPMDGTVLRGAAYLRAHYRVSTPDALHLAAALTRRCTAFVTNDRELPAVPGLRVVQLGAVAP